MNDVELIKQPYRRSCGQASVAIVSGKPVADIIQMFGTRGGTTNRKQIEVLGQLGFRNVRWKRLWNYYPLPVASLLRLRGKPGWGGHTVAFDGERVYDPELSTVRSLGGFLNYLGRACDLEPWHYRIASQIMWEGSNQ